jgi:hypothetical protein
MNLNAKELTVILAASSSGSNGTAIFVFGFIFVAWISYRAYVFFYRPEQWAAEIRMKHEKAMAAAAERTAKAGKIAGGILGGIAKAVLGAAIKGRPHH